MTVFPVIERELRVQSRLWFTYLIRVLGALALLCVFLWFGAVNGFPPHVGGRLFGWLNCTMMVSIWVLVPLTCADCISRERREGTVGLLFLTPLKAREVVLAKGMVHGIRSLSLLLAVLPMMTISFLIGGVTWKEAVLSAMVNFNCICWALAAGLLASSLSKSWLRAMLLACGLAGCFAVILMIITGWRVLLAVRRDTGFTSYYGTWISNAPMSNIAQVELPIGFLDITDMKGWWGTMFSVLKLKTQRAWLRQEGGLVLFSLVFLLVAVLVAAWNLRRAWQEEPPSARRLWFEKQLCTPIIGVNFFHRWMRRKLDQNPIGWLEQRTWSGRLVTWGWLAVMISFYSAALSAQNSWRLLGVAQNFLAWLLMGIIASSAAGSFQRERETRVLELLLVSSMSAGQIISGRLRGLWGQFVLTFGLLVFMWIVIATGPWPEKDFGWVPFFCAGYLTIPVIGLYYSLSRKHFISAFLWTVFTGILLPFVLKWLIILVSSILVFAIIGGPRTLDYQSMIGPLLNSAQHMFMSADFIVIIQAAIAIRCGLRLQRNLEERKFAFSAMSG
ncbi:MAG TPA: hypothetical protein VFB72_04770 [Verrucomicrobiae bacterium]|nr:hypothetical protein [Verrucomicrobiae bacterium]